MIRAAPEGLCWGFEEVEVGGPPIRRANSEA